jgi:hypothetical protein
MTKKKGAKKQITHGVGNVKHETNYRVGEKQKHKFSRKSYRNN